MASNLGELLLREKILSVDQLKSALDFQKKLEISKALLRWPYSLYRQIASITRREHCLGEINKNCLIARGDGRLTERLLGDEVKPNRSPGSPHRGQLGRKPGYWLREFPEAPRSPASG